MVITFYFKENVINNYPLNFGFLTVDTSYAAASIYCLWCSKCYNAKNCNNHKKWEDSWWTMECSTPTFKHHIPFYEHPKKKKKKSTTIQQRTFCLNVYSRVLTIHFHFRHWSKCILTEMGMYNQQII